MIFSQSMELCDFLPRPFPSSQELPIPTPALSDHRSALSLQFTFSGYFVSVEFYRMASCGSGFCH